MEYCFEKRAEEQIFYGYEISLLPSGVLFSLMKSNHFPHNITVTVCSLPPTQGDNDNFKYGTFYDFEFWLTFVLKQSFFIGLTIVWIIIIIIGHFHLSEHCCPQGELHSLLIQSCWG